MNESTRCALSYTAAATGLNMHTSSLDIRCTKRFAAWIQRNVLIASFGSRTKWNIYSGKLYVNKIQHFQDLNHFQEFHIDMLFMSMVLNSAFFISHRIYIAWYAEYHVNIQILLHIFSTKDASCIKIYLHAIYFLYRL